MKKNKVLSYTFLACGLMLFTNSQALAGDFQWSGVYRIEGYHLSNMELGGRELDKDYGLHHLVLRPKIVLGDGMTVYSQFDLFNTAAFPNSQLGQVMGSGVGDGVVAPTSSEDSNTIAGHNKSESLLISQLYLSWVQEYGALIVGRAPVQFGLGITHNAGRGLFDHWFDTRDMVAYKIMLGNLFIMPMYGKVSEGLLNENEDVNDYMVQVQYENPETDLEMGIFYQVRKASTGGSDAPTSAAGDLFGGPNAFTDLAVDYNILNIYALRDREYYRLGVEGSFMSGKTGVRVNGTDEKVSFNGFGLAAEFEYRPTAKKWTAGLKAGMATGDDIDSNNRFEGFVFDRNYDVAMLLFNHSLGQQDVLRTKAYGGGNTASVDVEGVSNVLYVAPHFNYRWTDKWKIKSVIATGWLNADPVAGATEVGTDLGYEVDVNLDYEPRKGVLWSTGVGMLFPGSAFEFNGEDPGFGYGIVSKAAISF